VISQKQKKTFHISRDAAYPSLNVTPAVSPGCAPNAIAPNAL
jgi:hypothetical protein